MTAHPYFQIGGKLERGRYANHKPKRIDFVRLSSRSPFRIPRVLESDMRHSRRVKSRHCVTFLVCTAKFVIPVIGSYPALRQTASDIYDKLECTYCTSGRMLVVELPNPAVRYDIIETTNTGDGLRATIPSFLFSVLILKHRLDMNTR